MTQNLFLVVCVFEFEIPDSGDYFWIPWIPKGNLEMFLNVFGLWEEAGVLGEDACMYR